jgi:hypothetical protein
LSDRRFFPPTAEAEKAKPDADPVKQDTEPSEDDAEPQKHSETDDAELASKLPDAPTTEPTNPDEPSMKKAKRVDTDDDYVLIEKVETEGHQEYDVAQPKANV